MGIRNRAHGRAVATDLCLWQAVFLLLLPSVLSYSLQLLKAAPSQLLYTLPLRRDHNFHTTLPSVRGGTTYIDYKRHNKHDQDELQLGVWDVTQEDLLKLQRKKSRKKGDLEAFSSVQSKK